MKASLRCLSLVSAVSLTLATPLSTASYDVRHRMQPGVSFAPLHAPDTPGSQIINNSYIVMFKEGTDPAAFGSHLTFLATAHEASPLQGFDSGLNHVYDSHIKGYSGWFTPDVVDLIRSQPEVDYVEHDQIVHTYDDTKTQKLAPWVILFSLLAA